MLVREPVELLGRVAGDPDHDSAFVLVIRPPVPDATCLSGAPGRVHARYRRDLFTEALGS